jgi:hypothetical protein
MTSRMVGAMIRNVFNKNNGCPSGNAYAAIRYSIDKSANGGLWIAEAAKVEYMKIK